MGKAVTYGIKDSRSIVEQREGLPIFKLKEQLIAAVSDNQVGQGGGCEGWVGSRSLPGLVAGLNTICM